MIRVTKKKLLPEDYTRLAEITIASHKDTPLATNISVESLSKNIENIDQNDDCNVLIGYNSAGEIISWMYLYTGFPLLTFIGEYQPVIEPRSYTYSTARSMIEAAKKKMVELSRKRLEIEVKYPSAAHRKMMEPLLEVYREAGFQLAAREVLMQCDLTAVKLKESREHGYTFSPLSEFSPESLKQPFFHTFNDSDDTLFLSMDLDEQTVCFNHWFTLERPLYENGSFIATKNGDIVGFIITRIEGNEPHLGPIGVVPEERGKGLGSLMTEKSLRSLQEDEYTKASLEMSDTNDDARILYEKYGFQEVFQQEYYYWTPRFEKM